MNHLFDILDKLEQLPPDSEAVLATVVSVEGSAYRQPGARMLILPDGQAVGMVSGGCLEKHLVQRAFWLTRNDAVVKTYHTATGNIDSQTADIDDKDDTWDEQEGFGLGCQGTIQVLFERIHWAKADDLLICFKTVKQFKQPQSLATIIASNTSAFAIGHHIDVNKLSNKLGDWQRVSQTPASRKSRFVIETYQRNNERIGVFVETLQPPLQLVIFGAGQDCLPLITMAHLQGWQVTVIDSRLDFISRHTGNRFATFNQLPLNQAEHIQSLLDSPQATAVVVMTHSISQDKVWLAQALMAKNPPLFIGQLGPRYRTEQLLSEILAQHFDLAALPPNLYYPVGLPLGGDTPEAVALSITAHIQQVYHEHA